MKIVIEGAGEVGSHLARILSREANEISIIDIDQKRLDKLSADEVVELDDDKKAAMVSNLMVVLCGDDTAQPVVNTGTLNM